MSASEKLRALEANGSSAPWEQRNASNLTGDGPVIASQGAFDWVASVQISNVSEWRENAALIVAIRNALPQIVAVVEAAEARLDGTSYETATPTAFGKSALYDALAALDEALT